MKHIKLTVVSPEGVEATVQTDGSQDGAEGFYAIVTIKGSIKRKKIYGIDPIQSFALGVKLIEKLTSDRRIGEDGDAPINGVSWGIEVQTL